MSSQDQGYGAAEKIILFPVENNSNTSNVT